MKQEVNAKIGIFAEHSREAITDEIRREDGMPQRVLRKMVELEARKLGHDGKDNNTDSSNDNNNIKSSRLATISAEMACNTQVQKKLRQRMDATEKAVAKLRKQEAQRDSGQEKVAFAMPDGPSEAEIHAVRLQHSSRAWNHPNSRFKRKPLGLLTHFGITGSSAGKMRRYKKRWASCDR